MNIKDIIRKKRDGYELSKDEIEFFAFSAADESIPDYQISALLMAIYLNGMTDKEMLELTDAMARSGDTADLSGINGIKADKHSTGGVGDKTSLIVAPIVSSCGVKIAKMSGRGLGHTGGTVDKLESIPGFRTSLSTEEFTEIADKCGLCIAGQSGRLCPADKKLYALRDATETVESLPLIASSIMSKKLAGGADCIVLDVKCGSGAFMKTVDSARELADKMVKIGRGAGKKIAALITDMDSPLGNCIGNSLEVWEAVQTLKGNGPDNLTELCIILSAKILELAGFGSNGDCRKAARSAIESGSALKKLAESVALQGGNPDYIYNPDLLPKSAYKREIIAKDSGFIEQMDARKVGSACAMLGAGRQKKEDSIDYGAGIVLNRKIGDKIKKGEKIAEMYSSDESLFEDAMLQFEESVTISDSKPDEKPILLEIIE